MAWQIVELFHNLIRFLAEDQTDYIVCDVMEHKNMAS